MQLFVGNLTCDTQSKTLAELFSQYGVVHSVSIHTSWQGAMSRTYAWIEMADHDAEAAMRALHGHWLCGKVQLTVSARRTRQEIGAIAATAGR